MKKRLGILASWNLLKVNGKYFIGGTHYTYLQYSSAHFEKVFLVTSVRCVDSPNNQMSIAAFSNIEVVELPAVNSYAGAILNFKDYCRAISYIKHKVDLVYCRVPDPFCWLPKLKYKMPSVMHFVGDTIDATLRNEKWSKFRKLIMIGGYLPDYALTLLASKKSTVYTNGMHLQAKLAQLRISATAVISSTVGEADLSQPDKFRKNTPPRMIYVGYLRFAKGMNLLKNLWLKLKQEWPDFKFDVVGNGEMENEVRRFVTTNGLSDNVILHGRIDSRPELKSLLRQADLFVFPSLSEGSPRVVIEAMAEGVPVISTPVGSLPGTFSDGDTIKYFDFDNVVEAYGLVKDFVEHPETFNLMRKRAYENVSSKYTIEKFLSQVYSL